MTTVLIVILCIVLPIVDFLGFCYLDSRGLPRGYTSDAEPLKELPKMPAGPAPGAPLTREQHDNYRWDQFVEDDGDHH